mmetsp:Transcript_48182/g.112735  ORF Transcript_48182/g.112735 Transcript_48182/m.112735 type:complete len:380 (-) Transcript_48182:109-1248(-)
MADAAKAKKQPPREEDLAGKYSNTGQYTTLMIRNIPPEYTQDELVEEVGEMVGGNEAFDFFYLPWDAQANANVGYAFVNFIDPLLAKQSMERFNNYRFRIHPSRKLGRTAYAHIQGLHNNLHHLRNRAVVQANRECTPIIMYGGRKIEVSKVFNQLSQGGGNSRSGTSGPPSATQQVQQPHSHNGRGPSQFQQAPQMLVEDNAPPQPRFFDDDEDNDVQGYGSGNQQLGFSAKQRFVAPRSAPGLNLPYDPDEMGIAESYGYPGAPNVQCPQHPFMRAPLSDHGGAIIAEDGHAPMMLSQQMHMGGGFLSAAQIQQAHSLLPLPTGSAPVAPVAPWQHSPPFARPDVQQTPVETAVPEITVSNAQERLFLKFMRKYGNS